MGIITRHANAPFADGEILAGADLEVDFATIYDEFNGSISAANLADLAVTTAKIAATAVTQAKMTSGAASASEAQDETSAVGVSIGTSFTTVGTPIVHTVGNPARHVVIMVSLQITFATGVTGVFQMLKDGVTLYPNQDDNIPNMGLATVKTTFTRVYIDTAPTPGGTHTYTFKAKAGTVGILIENLAIVAFEPRS